MSCCGAPVNVCFKNGETWTIDATFHDSAGLPLNVSTASVSWRLTDWLGNIITTLTLGNGITLVNGGVEGECLIVLTPAQQLSLEIQTGVYSHAAQVILADGTVTDQFQGFVEVKGSLF